MSCCATRRWVVQQSQFWLEVRGLWPSLAKTLSLFGGIFIIASVNRAYLF